MNDWRETLSALKVEKNKEELRVGSIFKMSMNERHGITPKDGQYDRDKFFAIVGFTSDGNLIGALIINKGINKYNYTNELYKDHYPLQQAKYKGVFIRNSFVCCTNIKEFRRDEIIKNASYEGLLMEDDCDLIIEHLRESETITIKDKKKYGIIEP